MKKIIAGFKLGHPELISCLRFPPEPSSDPRPYNFLWGPQKENEQMPPEPSTNGRRKSMFPFDIYLHIQPQTVLHMK